MSLLGTSALVRTWAVLADVHRTRRAVAMAEGEVSVSFGGIIAPLLVGGLAATVLSWRFAFVIGGTIVAAAIVGMGVGRGPAVIMVSGLYAANLGGRLLASRLARHITSERLLGASLIVSLAGLPILLAADDAAVAIVGIAVTGVGIGAMSRSPPPCTSGPARALPTPRSDRSCRWPRSGRSWARWQSEPSPRPPDCASACSSSPAWC
ncbi:MAG: hypothetical protein ACR2LV_08905 [Solirubrobacteraceae bacterium]